MKTRFLPLILFVSACCTSLLANAEDIDLFVGFPPVATDKSNVILFIDNTANWNTAFDNEKAAIVQTLTNLPVDKFNIGVVFFGQPDVGYVRAAIRPMTSTYKPLYAEMINNLDKLGDRGAPRTLARSMSEIYRYLKGQVSTSPSKQLTNDLRDYTGNVAGNAFTDAVHALPGNALSSATATTYNSPIDPALCANTYIIYIGNTIPSGNVVKDNAARNSDAGVELANAELAWGRDLTPNEIPLQYTSHQDNYADEWARFMKLSMGVRTYAVDVDPTPMPDGHSNGMGNSNLLQSMATVSDGKYFRVNSQVGGGAEVADALNSIFSEIQAKDSVFASVSLPVSVNTQGTFLNQVFIGQFRPDADGMPRWFGNLKQYKLGYDAGTLKLLDAANTSAINSTTGFITECARSFWTPTVLDTYWTLRPQGGCLAVANSDISNTPDGRVVEKGGQAYKLRSSTARTVKTCASTGSCTSLLDFDKTNVIPEMLGLASADTTTRDKIVDWAKGLDIQNEDIDGVTTGEMRMSAHGDVVHSRPVAINYGTDASPVVVVFYGGNDGMLRAVNGSRSSNIGSIQPGQEFWSFVPPEFHAQYKRLYENDITIKYPDNPVTTHTPLAKPYGMDGAVVAYQNGATRRIFATMRRGGRAIYAFNVSGSGSTPPSAPTPLWRIGPEVTGFEEIGQTWSAPQIMTTGYSSGIPLLIFGGGYDTCEDYDSSGINPPSPNSACSTPSSKGNKIYVVNAETGALLTTFTTDRSVAADIFVVPDLSSTTGQAKYAYAADTGGNVYRIAGATAGAGFGTTNPSGWTMTKIASLGCDTVTTCAGSNRKFLQAPDIVLDTDGSYAIMIGSGDREKPLTRYSGAMAVNNYFFMLRDKPSEATWLTSEVANCGTGNALICMDSLYPINSTATPIPEDLALKPKGWSLALRKTVISASGETPVKYVTEQVVTSAVTVYGTVTFSTHIPAVYTFGQCSSNLGTASVYNISYLDASNSSGVRYENVSGGGLPPSPVAGMVVLDDGSTVPFLIGGKGASALEGGEPPAPPPALRPKGRVYWQIQK